MLGALIGLLDVLSEFAGIELSSFVALFGLLLCTMGLSFFTYEISCGLRGSARALFPCYTRLIILFWIFTGLQWLAIGALVVSSDEVGVLRPLRLVRIVPWLALFPAVAISIMRWRRAAQMQTQPTVTLQPLIAMPEPGQTGARV